MSPPVLALDAVTKHYPGVAALRGVSLTVEPGELVAVTGPSGSGKSTLLHLIGTLDRPDSGTVRVTGHDVSTLDDRRLSALRASQIGFVFQRFHLAERATLAANVADALLYAGTPRPARLDQAAAALTRVGLADRLSAHPPDLSGGERQRVAIARALSGHPSLVLADEPTGNLDSTTGQAILTLLTTLNASGTTIIVITHDPSIAARMPREVTLLDGRVTSDVRRDPHR